MHYGYFRYSTGNIGDDVQSLAARRFLPANAHTFDRDDSVAEPSRGACFVIANGWYMHAQTDGFRLPMHPDIVPWFVSVHLQYELQQAFVPQMEDYFRRHEPIGCRDPETFRFLQSRGIASYISGCLTMTLGDVFPEPPVERRGVIAVDPHGPIPDALQSELTTVTHTLPPQLCRASVAARHAHAQQLLRRYRSAALVVTSRLHCALPALAFGTPVVVIHRNPSDSRFGALDGLLRVHAPGDEIDWHPQPVDIEKRAKPLRRLVAAAVRARSNPLTAGLRFPQDFLR